MPGAAAYIGVPTSASGVEFPFTPNPSKGSMTHPPPFDGYTVVGSLSSRFVHRTTHLFQKLFLK